MKIDSISIPESKPEAGKIPTQQTALNLKEGESIKAKVLFSEKGTVHLKAEDGQLIKARLSEGVFLPRGAEVSLHVSGKDQGTIFLSLSKGAGEDASLTLLASKLSAVLASDEFSSFSAALKAIKAPVTEETMMLMKEILKMDPSLGLEKAAFLAANKIPAEQNILKAAAGILNENIKTGDLIQNLSSLLSGSKEVQIPKTMEQEWAAFLRELQGGNTLPSAKADGPPLNHAVKILLSLFSGGNEGIKLSEVSVLKPEALQNQQAIDPKAPGIQNPEGNQQTKNAANNPQQAMQTNIQANTLPQAGQAGALQSVAASLGQANAVQSEAAFLGQASAAQSGVTPTVQANLSPLIQGSDGANNMPPQTAFSGEASANKLEIYSMLLKMPSFEGIPNKYKLDTFNLFYDIANELTKSGTEAAAPKALQNLLDTLFARPLANDSLAETMQRSKDELLSKLMIFEEAVKQSNLNNKDTLLSQTQRCIDHVRVLQTIDQFIYIQIPFQSAEYKNADLYIFKQDKASKKVDPDNIKILLALDLSNMGHLESFISILQKDVSFEFEAESEGAVSFIKDKTIELHKLLSEAGFKLSAITVRLLKDEITPHKGINALMAHEKRTGSQINFII